MKEGWESISGKTYLWKGVECGRVKVLGSFRRGVQVPWSWRSEGEVLMGEQAGRVGF